MPTSISLVITNGSGQDFVHALYQPGSVLRLGANIRDGYGVSTVGTPTTPCRPDYWLEDEMGPDGPRARLVGNVLTFLRDGKFTVRVRCLENPNITSRANEAPWNFETGSGTFAKATPEKAEAPAAAASGSKVAIRVVAVVLAVVGLGIVVYELKKVYDLQYPDDPGGDTCPGPTSCLMGDVLCRSDACGCPAAFHPTGHNTTYCPASQSLVCVCGPPARVGSAEVRDVRDLVARGIESQRPLPVSRERSSRPNAPSSGTRAVITHAQAGVRAQVLSTAQPPPRVADHDATRVTRKGAQLSVRPMVVPIAAAVARPEVTESAPPIAPSTTARRYDSRTDARPVAPYAELDVRAIALKVAFTAYAFVRAARGTAQSGSVEVVPWGEDHAAGLTVMGRF